MGVSRYWKYRGIGSVEVLEVSMYGTSQCMVCVDLLEVSRYGRVDVCQVVCSRGAKV
jgi:hypothetical protein